MQSFIRGCIATVVLGLLVVGFFLAGFLGASIFPTPFEFDRETASAQVDGGDAVAAPATEAPGNFEIFDEAMDVLRRDFYGELPSDEQVPYAAIRGVLGRLSDPNTIFVEPAAAEREQEQFQGEFGGIGAQVNANEEGYIVIVAPILDTPAERAGLQPEDVILEVDGTSIQGMPVDQAVELIRGPVGTEVTLLIQRPSEEESFTVTLTRDTIPDITVDFTMVEETDIGYIGMRFFSARTPMELENAIAELRAEGAEKFILDLRHNPGGLLDAAIATSSTFVGDGVIAYKLYNDGTREPLEANGNPIAPDEPMVVLIDEGSASASEILAGALQSYDRATLVGTTSYGKGTVQIPFTLSDGSSIHVTVAHWLTPDGTDLSSEGLTPDVPIEATPEQLQAGEDPAFDEAVELLQGEESTS